MEFKQRTLMQVLSLERLTVAFDQRQQLCLQRLFGSFAIQLEKPLAEPVLKSDIGRGLTVADGGSGVIHEGGASKELGSANPAR